MDLRNPENPADGTLQSFLGILILCPSCLHAKHPCNGIQTVLHAVMNFLDNRILHQNLSFLFPQRCYIRQNKYGPDHFSTGNKRKSPCRQGSFIRTFIPESRFSCPHYPVNQRKMNDCVPYDTAVFHSFLIQNQVKILCRIIGINDTALTVQDNNPILRPDGIVILCSERNLQSQIRRISQHLLLLQGPRNKANRRKRNTCIVQHGVYGHCRYLSHIEFFPADNFPACNKSIFYNSQLIGHERIACPKEGISMRIRRFHCRKDDRHFFILPPCTEENLIFGNIRRKGKRCLDMIQNLGLYLR